jgi:hypothetical protein
MQRSTEPVKFQKLPPDIILFHPPLKNMQKAPIENRDELFAHARQFGRVLRKGGVGGSKRIAASPPWGAVKKRRYNIALSTCCASIRLGAPKSATIRSICCFLVS